MSLVTIIWSMIASACFTLAAIYCVVWYRNRTTWPNFFFAVTAVSTMALAFCELRLMRAQSVEEVLAARTLAHVPLFFWLVSITWFVRTYLGAGRLWLAWTICGLRALSLVVNLSLGLNPDFGNVTALRHVEFLGEQVTVLGAAPNRATPITQFASFLVLIFVADASLTAWRRGDRRKALMVGGAVEFFLIASLGSAVAMLWAGAEVPAMFSLFYMGLVIVMGYELSRDVLRASQLVHDLQRSEAGLRESEARLSLAVDAADFGIWIRDLGRGEIWASEKWRELFGFTASEPVQLDMVLNRLHPEDRATFQRAHTTAGVGPNEGRYQIEYRVQRPDGTTRWIASLGRVERSDSGHPILIRGAARDITASKHAELAIRNLSGRLLSAQEDERRRIARELHDNLSQQMAVLTIKIGEVAKRLDEPRAVVAASMRDLGRLAVDVSGELHSLSHQLHSSKLDLLGLVDALKGHCDERLAQGIRVHFTHQDVPATVPHDVALCLFRIAQEALNNVAKHSASTEAEVTLSGVGNAILLTVADPGRGFDEAGARAAGGLGLASMRERLRLLEGRLTVQSEPGRGTTISARVPLSPMVASAV